MALLKAWLALVLLAPQMAPQAPEYRVKAVFLYNFAQFVDWPADAFPGAGAPLVIGILGDDPFGPLLDETVHGEMVGGRPIEIRRFKTASEIKNCQILFISEGESGRLGEILAVLKDRPILTVGDAKGFSTRGGMVRFVMENNRIRLRVNLEAAQAAKLVISSKVLRAAEIVTTRTP